MKVSQNTFLYFDNDSIHLTFPLLCSKVLQFTFRFIVSTTENGLAKKKNTSNKRTVNPYGSGLRTVIFILITNNGGGRKLCPLTVFKKYMRGEMPFV